MSAPPLAEIGPISDGASFYKPPEEVSNTAEAALKTGEELSPTVEDTQGSEGVLPRDGAFKIATDLDSVQAPYIGEDARVTQLRRIDQMFRRMAGDPTNASLPHGALEFLPDMTRGLIQFIGRLQADNGEIERRNAQLQQTQETFLVEKGNMEARINWLQVEHDKLKDTNWRLEVKNADLRRNVLEIERSYMNMKAQKDNLKRQLDESKNEEASDSGEEGPSKKRGRQE